MSAKRLILTAMIIIFFHIMVGCEVINNNASNNNNYSGYSSHYNYNNYNYNYNFNFNYYSKDSAITSSTKTYIIALAMADVSSPYYKSLIDYAREESEKLGMELMLADAEWDVQKQVDQISGFIRQRVDVIILMPVDVHILASSVKRIKEANIPLINLNNRLDDIIIDLVDSYIGTSPTEQGELAAELMLEALEGKGGNIAVVKSEYDANMQLSKTQGFIDKISQIKNINIVSIKSIPRDRKREREIIKSTLNEHPQIDGIFVDDDNMIISFIEAAEAINRKGQIKFVGIGGSKVVYEAIEKGELYGTIAQSPGWEGAQAIKCAFDILHGKKVSVWYRDSLFKVTQENIDKYRGIW